jgi:glutaredoxin-like YruB-family protein
MENTENINPEKKLVEIYSTPTCHFCHIAKDWFTEKGVDYVDYDVSVDAEKRRHIMEVTGQMGVPVIVIGNDVVIGFNQEKLQEILNIK